MFRLIASVVVQVERTRDKLADHPAVVAADERLGAAKCSV